MLVFLREWLETYDEQAVIQSNKEKLELEERTLKAYNTELLALEKQDKKNKDDYKRIVKLYKLIDDEEAKVKEAKKILKTTQKIKYVKRDAVRKIIAAWLITVPAAALLSAMIFFMIKGMLI